MKEKTMTEAKYGDVVRVHYTGKFDDGVVFDTSAGRDPLQFTIGNGEIIPGFEQAVVGMKPGETKTIKIPSDEAYGRHNDEMVLVVDRNQFPADLNLRVGMPLHMHQENGRAIPVMVVDISELHVTLDANHPLAGKDLTFDIELV